MARAALLMVAPVVMTSSINRPILIQFNHSSFSDSRGCAFFVQSEKGVCIHVTKIKKTVQITTFDTTSVSSYFKVLKLFKEFFRFVTI